MTNTILNQIANITIQAVLSILGVVATYLITITVSYFKKKREALIQQMGVDQYNSTYNIAKSVYFMVEQIFKFVPGAAQQKAAMFDRLLLSKVQGLTQDEIDHFREAICGEMNSQVSQANLFKPAPLIDINTEEVDPAQTKTDTPADTNTETSAPNNSVADTGVSA